jgi:hypothetical protein
VKNEAVLQRVKEERNILHTISLLECVTGGKTEGRIEVTGR